MKTAFFWFWCLPQNILGFFIKLLTNAKKVGDHYEYNLKSGSVSLGKFIFLCPSDWGNDMTLRHEKGHQKQSLILGWFYLIVIGIPSIVWAECFKEYRIKHNISYYSFYTEKWADKLGCVKRN